MKRCLCIEYVNIQRVTGRGSGKKVLFERNMRCRKQNLENVTHYYCQLDFDYEK
jgi:hypothetical protein